MERVCVCSLAALVNGLHFGKDSNGGWNAYDRGAQMPIIKSRVIAGQGVVIWYIFPDGRVATMFYPYQS
jgi:hypothetical protein